MNFLWYENIESSVLRDESEYALIIVGSLLAKFYNVVVPSFHDNVGYFIVFEE